MFQNFGKVLSLCDAYNVLEEYRSQKWTVYNV